MSKPSNVQKLSLRGDYKSGLGIQKSLLEENFLPIRTSTAVVISESEDNVQTDCLGWIFVGSCSSISIAANIVIGNLTSIKFWGVGSQAKDFEEAASGTLVAYSHLPVQCTAGKYTPDSTRINFIFTTDFKCIVNIPTGGARFMRFQTQTVGADNTNSQAQYYIIRCGYTPRRIEV